MRRELPAFAHCTAYTFYKRERDMAAEFAASVAGPSFAYARANSAGGSLYVIAYGRDDNSPTGVRRLASCLNFEEAIAIMDAAGKPFPLSPTEGLNKSGVTA